MYPGTILFAWAGTRGVSFGPTIWNGPLGVLNQHIYRITPREDVNPDWLFWALKAITARIERQAHGFKATLVHVRKSEITGQVIGVPPLAEQHKIAQILCVWDTAIARLEQLISAVQLRKRGLMQRLLTGQVRFAGFAEQWTQVALRDIAQITMGQSPSSENYNSEMRGLPLVQGNTDIKNRRTAPRLYTSEVTRACQVNDIVLSVRAPIGEVALAQHQACIGRGVCAIRATNTSQEFLYQMLWFCEPAWSRIGQGSTFTAINSRDVNSFVVTIPATVAEQAKIARVLMACDDELTLYDRKLAALKQQKRGLVQRLLAGQVRVHAADLPRHVATDVWHRCS